VGSTIQKEDDLVLLNHQDYPEPLGLDVGNLVLERKRQNPSFKGAIWPLL
jgi:hypothetical protein